MLVRVSIGTLAKLGLTKISMEEEPQTAYLLQFSSGGCLAGCRFCTQSRISTARRDFLARITWPVVKLDQLLDALSRHRGAFKRICIQTVLKEGFLQELLEIVKKIREADVDTPISAALTPVSREWLRELIRHRVGTIGVGLDAATPTTFRRVGKPYTWSMYMKFIDEAVSVFGKGNVYVHIIAGLGDSIADIIRTMIHVYRAGARVALFNYVYVSGVDEFPGISVEEYRVIQIARALLDEGYNPLDFIDIDRVRVKRELPISVEDALLTSGCPSCNRPFYNESPKGVIYNYPSKRILRKDRSWVEQLKKIGVNLLD